MKGFVDLHDPTQDKKVRVQVEVKAVHPDGSYDYDGELYGAKNALLPLYDENGVQVTPTAETDAVGELVKKVAALEKDMQTMKVTKQAPQ
jgi:hypothetical protein